MYKKNRLYHLVLLVVVIFSLSCNRDDSSRTKVRTTDAEIPTQPPADRPASTDPVSEREEEFRRACLEGDEEAVDQYIMMNLDVSAADENGRTGLMLAAFNGHTIIVKKLLENGADVNRADMMGRTSLMYASTGHFPDTVALLLSNGADPNMVDKDEQFTALMFAGAEGNTEVIRLLLDNGAVPGMKDNDGDTAEDFARQNGHEQAAEMLQNARSGKN